MLDIMKVQGDSMDPAVKDGSHVLINRMAYFFGNPDAGDVVAYPHKYETIKNPSVSCIWGYSVIIPFSDLPAGISKSSVSKYLFILIC